MGHAGSQAIDCQASCGEEKDKYSRSEKVSHIDQQMCEMLTPMGSHLQSYLDSFDSRSTARPYATFIVSGNLSSISVSGKNTPPASTDSMDLDDKHESSSTLRLAFLLADNASLEGKTNR